MSLHHLLYFDLSVDKKFIIWLVYWKLSYFQNNFTKLSPESCWTNNVYIVDIQRRIFYKHVVINFLTSCTRSQTIKQKTIIANLSMNEESLPDNNCQTIIMYT